MFILSAVLIAPNIPIEIFIFGILIYTGITYILSNIILYEKINILLITGIQAMGTILIAFLLGNSIDILGIIIICLGYMFMNYYYIRKNDIYTGSK